MSLTYDRAGSGAPLVLIHGLGSARTVWKPVMPSLAESFDVIAVDLPGHGRTPWVEGTPMDPRSLADRVVQALDACGVTQVHLLANSLGGWVALEIAAAYPHRVASVTALAPAGMRDKPLTRIRLAFKLNRYLAVAASPLLPLLLSNPWLRGIGFARNSPVWKTWAIETCRDAAEAMAQSRGYEAALSATIGRMADCTQKIPPSIPLTIVFGDTDLVLPATTSQSRRHVPAHARWLEWERCGHAIQLDYPERVVALVKEVAVP
ncbi:MAG TPA: alpha/beta fold hydrolase [Kofleriaceae bacterium]|nr:alpha/beta fold hydrolase [Kofleriaceae bacterium]